MRRRLVGSALCVVLLGMFLYDAHHLPQDDTFTAIEHSKIWRIGVDISNPPFASEPDGHTPVGLDLDLAKALAARLGVQIQVQPLGYDGLYDALRVGTVDGLISALSIDPARLGDVRYTAPYFDNGLVIAATNPKYTQMADLDGERVAVEYGSTADQTARLWQRRLHRLNVQFYSTTTAALDAARADQAEAALSDAITARLYRRPQEGLTLSAVYVTSDPYAVAVRLDSFALADALNKALDAMRADGSLDAIIAKWL